MLAAGYDLPYVQDQVAHPHPTTTLAIYAQVIRRPDRDRLRAEIRDLLGVPETEPHGAGDGVPVRSPCHFDTREKARKRPREANGSVRPQPQEIATPRVCRRFVSTPSRIRTGDLRRERPAS